MACTVLRQPEAQPSSEAAHAALLLAHVAWNRAAGFGTPDYRPILREFETSNAGLWNELTSSDAEVLIAALGRYKQVHHLHDHRQVVVCGMRGDNVHVEWIGASELK